MHIYQQQQFYLLLSIAPSGLCCAKCLSIFLGRNAVKKKKRKKGNALCFPAVSSKQQMDGMIIDISSIREILAKDFANDGGAV
jgi:hypothetical protein